MNVEFRCLRSWNNVELRIPTVCLNRGLFQRHDVALERANRNRAFPEMGRLQRVASVRNVMFGRSLVQSPSYEREAGKYYCRYVLE